MQEEWIDKAKKYLANTYTRFPIVVTKGDGCWVWDMNGRRYMDFLSGIAVCNLGHVNPSVVDAITHQAARLGHISNLFYMEPQIRAAELLTYHAAWLKDRGGLTGKEAAMAKFYSTEAACFVVDEVSRIHGAYGVAEEYPAQRYFRDGRFLLFGGGTSEILKTIIAKDTMKKCEFENN